MSFCLCNFMRMNELICMFRFVKEHDQWKITELVMTAVWASGNQNIMNLAGQHN